MSVSFGEFELDPALFELRRAGRRVALEPQAFDVLYYLAQHRDRVVSKEELMDQIWGGRFVSESAVTSRIKQARRAVGDDGTAQHVIATMHGRGYRFVAPVEGQPVAANPEDRPRLFGRDRDLATVDRLIQGARAGTGGVLVVSGEPGIGKSALLGEVSSRVMAAGGRVLSGRAVESSGPFRPLAEALLDVWPTADIREAAVLRPFRGALDRLLPGWGTEAPQRAEDIGADPVLLVAEGVAQILTQVDTEFGLLVVDDAQHSDPDTVAVLEHLAATASRRPVLVAIARDEWPPSVGLDRVASTPGAVRISLSRLGPDAISALVTASRELTPEAVAAIVTHAEGLPAVAAELASAAGETDDIDWTFSQGVGARVEARLFALDEDERRILAAAAVLGDDPAWDLVPAIAGVDDQVATSALRQALRRHLLTQAAGRLRWRHGFIPQIVWATLLPPERRAVTQAAARALTVRGSASDATTAAELLHRVGDVDGAADLWLALAGPAAARGGVRTAASLLDRADATGRRRVAVATQRVELLTLAGRPSEALELGRPVLEDARGDEHAELCFQLARAAGAAGRWAEAVQYVARAGRDDDPRAAILRSDAAHAVGRMAQAEEYAARAVAGARAEARTDVLCEALCTEARARRLHDLDAAAALFAEAAQQASEHGLLPWRVEALFGLATIEILLEEQSPQLLEARRLAVDAGLLGQAARANLLLADHVLLRDGPGGSAEPATDVAQFGRLAGHAYLVVASELMLAGRSALAGDERAMEFRLDKLDTSPELPPDFRGQALAVRGEAAMVRHDLPRALDLFDAAMRPMVEHASAAPFALLGAWALVQTLVRNEAPEVRALLAEQTGGRRRANRGAVRYADAVVAGRSGDRAAAEVALADGDELLAPTPWWQRFLRTFVLEAAVTEGWADAVPRLRVDLAAFEAAGEEPMARLVRDLLRQAGAPTRRGRGDSSVPIGLRALGVTSREMDVLRLLEEGLSNVEIGSRLFLSPRTVETHVSNLLMKSGASNRGELTAWAAGTA